MRYLMTLLCLLVLTLPATAQQSAGPTMTLKELLSSTTYPQTLKLKDLDGDWKRLTINPMIDLGGTMQMMAALMGTSPNVYYTKGDSIAIGAQNFVVAYHIPSKPLNFANLMQMGQNGAPAPEKLTPDTPITLTLINLTAIGSLSDVRSFDLQQEIAEKAQVNAMLGENRDRTQEIASVSNLKQLALATLMYTQDYDEKFPPMKTSASTKKMIYPYIKNDQVFIEPRTGQIYSLNPFLSRKTMTSITRPSEIALWYEPTSAPDNTRAVAFVDGHVKRIPEADWPKVKQISKIP